MGFIDPDLNEWEAARRVLPWKQRFVPRVASVLDGNNDPVDLVVGLAISMVMTGPFLLEFVVQVLLLPFVLALRSIGVMTTPVTAWCTARAVGTNPDGSPRMNRTGSFEAWTVSVSGFSKAGRLRNAITELIRAQGNRADVEAFARQWQG